MSGRRMLRGLAAIAVIVAIIGGVPLVLLRIGGSPIPAHVPGWHRVGTVLTERDDTGSLFFALVRDLTWLAWLIFSAALLVELQAAARGRLAPRLHIGGIQGAAAKLAAIAALSFSAPAGFSAAGVGAAAVALHLPSHDVATVRPAAGPAHRAVSDVVVVRQGAVPAQRAAGDVVVMPPAGAPVTLAASQPAVQYITVQPGDCLWTLSEHYLGAGDLYPEIANLNVGHVMDDGVTFTNPSLIYPGWQLAIPVPAGAQPAAPAQPASPAQPPASAQPPGTAQQPAPPTVHSHPVPGQPATSHEHAGHHTSDSRFGGSHPAAGHVPAAQSPASQSAAGGRHRAASAQPSGDHEERLIAEGAALALFAGGVLACIAALRRRQRNYRRPGRMIALPAEAAPQHMEQTLRAADTFFVGDAAAPPSDGLRNALQELAAGLRASGSTIPDFVGVHLVPEPPSLEILLASPAGQPPAPFTVAPGRQDMCWLLDLAHVRPEALQGMPGRAGDVMPGLFTVGTTTSGYLLLDLELLHTAVVRGDPAFTDQFITTAAMEFATNQWSGWYDLIVAGPFNELGHLDRAEQCDTLDDALRLLRQRKQDVAGRLGAAGGHPGRSRIRDMRLNRPDDEDWGLTLLVSRMPASPTQLDELIALSEGDGGIAVLIPSWPEQPVNAPVTIDLQVGVPDPSDATATIRLGFLGDGHEIAVRPAVLTAAEYQALGSLFGTAATLDDVPADAAPYDDFVTPPWMPSIVADMVDVPDQVVYDTSGPAFANAAAGYESAAPDFNSVAPAFDTAYSAADTTAMGFSTTGPDFNTVAPAFDDAEPANGAVDSGARRAQGAVNDSAAAFLSDSEASRRASGDHSGGLRSASDSGGLRRASGDHSGSLPSSGGRNSAPAAVSGELRIGILGPIEITGTERPVSGQQAELVVALALTAPEGLSSPALAALLGTDPSQPKPESAVRQLVSRTRRALGSPSGGGYYIRHDDGQYVLSGARLDWAEFAQLFQDGLDSRDPAKLAAAMALVRGRPLDGSRYWWLDASVIEIITAQVVDASLRLAEIQLADGAPAAAAATARTGLLADAAAEQLTRVLMRSEHAAGNLAGVTAAWAALHEAIQAVDPAGSPEAETTELYRALTSSDASRPIRMAG